MTVEVVNAGEPLPADFSLENSTSLGLSIVRTLVADLGGSFELLAGEDDLGTVARVRVPLI